MKKLFAMTLVAAYVALAGTAVAVPYEIPEDMSWWGNTGATPDPYPDATRSGHWWYPEQPESDVDDTELYGNRGIVYHIWEKPAPPVETPAPTPAPPAPAPTAPTRSVPVPADFLFDFDKSIVKPEGKQVLDNQILPELQKYPGDRLTIKGHTCTVGDDAYNMGLGQRRADSVKSYLVNAGIDAGRIDTVSFGETQPAVPNDTAANRKLNRRVVMEFQIKAD
jgi:outer membrane protein OmpA-like peptidoglycan-associated protein